MWNKIKLILLPNNIIKVYGWFFLVIYNIVFIKRIYSFFDYETYNLQYFINDKFIRHYYIESIFFFILIIGCYGLIKKKKYGWIITQFHNIDTLLQTLIFSMTQPQILENEILYYGIEFIFIFLVFIYFNNELIIKYFNINTKPKVISIFYLMMVLLSFIIVFLQSI